MRSSPESSATLFHPDLQHAVRRPATAVAQSSPATEREENFSDVDGWIDQLGSDWTLASVRAEGSEGAGSCRVGHGTQWVPTEFLFQQEQILLSGDDTGMFLTKISAPAGHWWHVWLGLAIPPQEVTEHKPMGLSLMHHTPSAGA
eukprot:CAMPEP_0174351670 /NCGR_PEP_ID=MMETSP0811_2-20130205/9080_1 /TAXON_ID=73025 ORGANISM="Eutreptiella gymnastica-like, Strain CCMP1594" /NCGR_SAMPLE_ID=MMETSP0811_2 /ASSEMBLY_ACC=CAM_ASM_000667 /LENGTH=144 /DNA_ID=CAMNT_0015481093 /DNA_START=602 /DNA_END=1038 /DNA_ORIENTATION=+